MIDNITVLAADNWWISKCSSGLTSPCSHFSLPRRVCERTWVESLVIAARKAEKDKHKSWLTVAEHEVAVCPGGQERQ